MRWPWSKKEHDDSWEALADSRRTLRDTRSRWSEINEVVVEANIAAARVRNQREQNNFKHLIFGLLGDDQ